MKVKLKGNGPSVSICLFVCLVISLFGYLLFWGEKYGDSLKEEVLRLHILANSNESFDQELKLKVRDRLLMETEDIFKNSQEKSSAKNLAEKNIKNIVSICEDEVRKNGYSYSVTAKVGKSFFPTKTYGKFVFPAGSYDALKIEIGKGEGKNWWCVLFPQLCLPSCQKEASSNFPFKESSPELKVSFFCVELLEKLKNS